MRLLSYNQPSSAPVPKVQAVAGAGAVITAIVTLLALMGVIVPESVSQAAEGAVVALFVVISALQTILTFAAGYFKKDVKPAEAVKIIKEEGEE